LLKIKPNTVVVIVNSIVLGNVWELETLEKFPLMGYKRITQVNLTTHSTKKS